MQANIRKTAKGYRVTAGRDNPHNATFKTLPAAQVYAAMTLAKLKRPQSWPQ